MDKNTEALARVIHEIRKEYEDALQGNTHADPQFAVMWADYVAQQFEGTIPSAQEAFDKWIAER